MRRLVAVAMVAVLGLAACGGTPAATPAPTPTVDVRPAQTIAALQAQVSSLQATLSAPTATATTPPPTAFATLTPTIPPTFLPPTLTATSTRPRPTVTPTPANVAVAVRNVSNYRDTIGTLWYIGEVVNTGQSDVSDVRVAISLLGDTGQTVASGSSEFVSPPILPIVKAGQKAVWKALVRDAPATWKEERIQVQAGPVGTFARTFYYYDLRAEGIALAPPARSPGWVTASGQVVNAGTQPTRYASVTIAAYDDAGKLLAIGNGLAKLDEIAPDGSAPFSFDIDQLKAAPARYDVYVVGQAVR